MYWILSFLATPAYAVETIPLLESIKTKLINPIIQLFFVLAVVVFLYGVVEFIWNSDNDTGRTKGKQHIIWGLIGLFIMISVFGIINLICKTIGAC